MSNDTLVACLRGELAVAQETSAAQAQRIRQLEQENQALTAKLAEQETLGEVVVTTTEDGVCVVVSRQDEEGRILSVIWEAPEPAKKEKADATPWLDHWMGQFDVVLKSEAYAALANQLGRSPYPDFRPELSKLTLAVQDYEEATESMGGDTEATWSAIMEALAGAEAALCKDARDAAMRYSTSRSPVIQPETIEVPHALRKSFASMAQQAVETAMNQVAELSATIVDQRLGKGTDTATAIRALKT